MNKNKQDEKLKKELERLLKELEKVDISAFSEEKRVSIMHLIKRLENDLGFPLLYEEKIRVNELQTEFLSSEEQEIVLTAIEDVIGALESGFVEDSIGDDRLHGEKGQVNSNPGKKNVLIRRMQRLLADENNSKAVQDISLQVLKETRPQDMLSAEIMITPLINDLTEGKVMQFAGSTEPGGLGGSDLLIMLVVSLVTAILEDLLENFSKRSIQEIKQLVNSEKEKKALVEMKLGDIEAVISITKYPGGKRKVEDLAKVVNDALIKYIEAIE